MLWIKIWGWLKKAWSWFKANWKWVLFPVGGLLLLLSLFRRRQPDVLVPELVEHQSVADAANEKAADAIAKAKNERDQQVAEAKEDHAKAVKELSAEQKQKAEELKDDPQALNDFLLEVGKDIRK